VCLFGIFVSICHQLWNKTNSPQKYGIVSTIFKLVIKDIIEYIRQLQMRVSLQKRGIFLSQNAVIRGKTESFTAGHGCTISSHSIIEISDDPNGQTKDSRLTLEKYVYIGESCNIRPAGSLIRIGANSMIANGVTIVGSNHGKDMSALMRLQPWDMNKSGVSIGKDCWIAAGAIICPGSKIEDGAIVAAGAVVIGHVQAHSIVAGVPARFVRMRD